MPKSFTPLKRYSFFLAIALGAVSLPGCQTLKAENPTQVSPAMAASGETDPVIAAVGDIACGVAEQAKLKANNLSGPCQMKATSDLVIGQPFAAVLAIGDLQYPKGELAEFQGSYDVSWGKVKSITRPVPGNHEYYTPGATGYYTYFGAIAQDPTKGYYSYNLGKWHIIALNSNCKDVGCAAGSPQETWLKADLKANPAQCTLAYWHHPRFSSGLHNNDPDTDAFWRTLYAGGADVILTAHDHEYERFDPQTPDAKADSGRGIREFVVGTGGFSLRPFRNVQPRSKVRNSDTYGILKLTLKPKGYDWQFVPIKGQTFTDSGSGDCHT